MAAMAAPTVPKRAISWRKVTGPILSERISRSRSIRSPADSPSAIASADFGFGAADQAADILAMLPEHEQGEAREQQGEVDAAEQAGGDRRGDDGAEPADRRITGERQHAEPDDRIGRRGDPTERADEREAEQQAEDRRDALTTGESQPDGVEMTEKGAEGGERRLGEQEVGEHDRDRPLRHVEQHGGGGEALAA